MPGSIRDLAEFEFADLETAIAPLGIQPCHARQIYRWIHRRAVTDVAQMTDLSRRHRDSLANAFALSTPRVAKRYQSSDGTTKLLLELGDGRRIEAVYIPDSPAHTFCLSTQVGCAMQCAFCLTARMGLERHLTAGEIAGQVRVLASELGLVGQPVNVVLMGMGEPLHNYDATMQALRMIMCEHGAALSPRRITLSTVGILPALTRLAAEPIMPNLAISLHGTTDAQRSQMVPINRRYPLADLLAACRAFPLKRRNRITFEYVLIKDVNDSIADAHRLAHLLGGLRAKVNVIPLNAAPGIPFERPSASRIDRFGRLLADHHLSVDPEEPGARHQGCVRAARRGGDPAVARPAAREPARSRAICDTTRPVTRPSSADSTHTSTRQFLIAGSRSWTLR